MSNIKGGGVTCGGGSASGRGAGGVYISNGGTAFASGGGTGDAT